MADIQLTEYEKDLLVDVSVQPHPDLGLSWGAAMSVAMEHLKSVGYLKQTGGTYKITPAGEARAKEICDSRYH